jgi:S-adenosylmethionine:tRNA ribosyltransferase-isomerase
MHNEYIEISKETANKLNIYKSQGKRIIAVGTTAVRVLESFAEYNKCHSILDTVSFNCQYTLTY